jgi:hypothetical protein
MPISRAVPAFPPWASALTSAPPPRTGRGFFQTGQSMKEAVKSAFKQAIEKYQALATAAKQEQANKLTAREGFEIEYRRVRDKVIIPALKEVANDLLDPAGWKCDIRQDEKDIETTLEVYRDDMKAVSGEGRPRIGFAADASRRTVNVYSASLFQGEPSHSYEPEAITEEVIHHEVLKFFQRLASEG